MNKAFVEVRRSYFEDALMTQDLSTRIKNFQRIDDWIDFNELS
jgi:hypothetical protein